MPRLCSSLLLSLLVASSASAVTMAWTPIGNPGNTCDPQSQGCFGAVGYEYYIGTYEVTNAQSSSEPPSPRPISVRIPTSPASSCSAWEVASSAWYSAGTAVVSLAVPSTCGTTSAS
jgi:hypothetical protein